MDLELENAVINVISIGTAGKSAVAHMKNSSIKDIEFIDEDDVLHESLKNTALLFLLADIDEHTKIKAVAEIARELNILTIAVVTAALDNEKVAELEQVLDSIIIIPNDSINTVDEILLNAVRGMTAPVTQRGIIGFDFADLKAITHRAGQCVIGVGTAAGENRAEEATEKALSFALYAPINLQNTYGLLLNISAQDIAIAEFDKAANIARDLVSEDTIIKVGLVTDDSLADDEMRVTVFATGLGKKPKNTNKNRAKG